MTAAVTVTFFRNFSASEKWERTVPLDALAERIATTFAPAKSELPWLKLARFGHQRTEAKSFRHDANVLGCTGVEADYDGGELGFEHAVEVAEKAGLLSIIYTSPSHTPDRPRWRVLAPGSCEFSPDQRFHLLGRLNGLYRGIFARESWTLSQAYYYGAVQGRHHRVELVDGQPIDLLHELDPIWQGPPGAQPGVIGEAGRDAREDAELIRRIVSGDGFHCELTALAARYVGRGVRDAAVADILSGIMLSHPEGQRDQRWHQRYGQIGGIVASATTKYAGRAQANRAIARITHSLAAQARPCDEIVAAVRDQAKELDLPEEAAVALCLTILREKVEVH